MDKAVEMLDKMVEAIKSLAVQHGDAALQLTLEVARLKAIQVLLNNGVQLLLGLAMAIVAYKLLKRAHALWDDFSADDPIGWFIGGTLTSVVAFIVTIEAISKLILMKYWIGIYNPSMYLAMELLDKAVK